MTKIETIISEHKDDDEALIAALSAFKFRQPEPSADVDGSAEWFYDALDRSAGRDTILELEERVAMGQVSRNVFNAVVEAVYADGGPDESLTDDAEDAEEDEDTE